MNEITKFEQFFSSAVSRINSAETTDEVIAVHTEAVTLAAAAKAAKEREYEEKAQSIRFQAERKLGQLMAAQRDAGMMNKGGKGMQEPYRGNGSPSIDPTLNQAGIDKNLAKAARKAYPEGYPKKRRSPRMTPEELVASGHSPKAERYYDEVTGTSRSRPKVLKDDLDAANKRIAELEAENARLKNDLEVLQRGEIMRLSAQSLAKRKAIIDELKIKRAARQEKETVIKDNATKEAFERRIDLLSSKLRNAKSKIQAFMLNGKTILSNADRKSILVCLHPDGTMDPKEKSRRELAFKLFSNAVPECEFDDPIE
jgi:hypothetical protein